MKTIRRGNVELIVEDDFLNYYLQQGYNEIGTSGEILTKGIPNNFTDLKREYFNLKAENEKLRSELNKIKSQTNEKSTAKKNKPKNED